MLENIFLFFCRVICVDTHTNTHRVYIKQIYFRFFYKDVLKSLIKLLLYLCFSEVLLLFSEYIESALIKVYIYNRYIFLFNCFVYHNNLLVPLCFFLTTFYFFQILNNPHWDFFVILLGISISFLLFSSILCTFVDIQLDPVSLFSKLYVFLFY